MIEGMRKSCYIRIIRVKHNMVDSDPEKLVEEMKSQRDNSDFFPKFLEIYCTSKTRALKAESLSWVNSLPLDQLGTVVCPVFIAAFLDVEDLLAQ